MRTTSVYGEFARELVAAAGLYLRAQRQLRATDPQPITTLGRAGHDGAPAHAIDVETDEFMREVLRQREPSAVYISEESDSGRNLTPTRVFFFCDPLDGTGPWLGLNFGWAVACWFVRVRRDSRSYAFMGGAIYCASGEVVSFAKARDAGYVRIDFPAAPIYADPHHLESANADGVLDSAREPKTVWLVRDDEDDTPGIYLQSGDPRRVASVAASPARREKLFNAFDLSGLDVWTLGGNPIITALLLLELGAVIEIEPTALRDCLYLLPLKLAGGYIESLDGAPIDVFAAFEAVDGDHRIGPFIASASPAIVRDLRKRRRLDSAA
jgi:hypothetical protein